MRTRSFWKLVREDQAGKLLVEASITLPVVMICTVLLLGLGYTAYQKTSLTQEVFEWTERAAYVWKDSHRDPVTGAFSYEDMDGIYTSAFSEGLGWIAASWNGFEQAGIRFPDRRLTGSQLSGTKLLRSSESSDAGMLSGQAGYFNRLFEGEIRAEWSKGLFEGEESAVFFRTPGWSIQASSYYGDPVEFLRTVDLVRTYSQKLIYAFQSRGSATDELNELLPDAAERSKITSEKQAKAFLQQVIGGSSLSVRTTYGVRQIDVLDSDQVMHEAKYTVNKKDARTQILKDAELIRTGHVKGVVWHFFPLEKTGRCDITPSLRKELEQNGIIVVLHR